MSDLQVSITDFLLARIAEDEALARAASPGPWHTNAEGDEVLALDDITVAEGFALSGPQLRATTQHIARHDPSRVLAECKAKRVILSENDQHGTMPVIDDYDCPATRIVKSLAAVYADHPEYDESWRP